MSAASSGEKNVPGTLCAIARRNSPAARGMASSAATDPPPADSPNTVTRSGSPPNAAMLSRTHSQRGDLVEQPPVGGRAVDLRETLDAQPVVEASPPRRRRRGQPAAVVLGQAGRAEHVAAAVDPHHAPAGRRRAGSGDHTLTVSQSSRSAPGATGAVGPSMNADCGGGGPNVTASRTPSQAATGCGAANRSAPTGGSANGMPRKTATPFSARRVPARPPYGPRARLHPSAPLLGG